MAELSFKHGEDEHQLWVNWKKAHDKRYERQAKYINWIMQLLIWYEHRDPKYRRCKVLAQRLKDEQYTMETRLAQMEQFYQDGDHFLVAKLRLSV
jgi:hypothetical protein